MTAQAKNWVPAVVLFRLRAGRQGGVDVIGRLGSSQLDVGCVHLQHFGLVVRSEAKAWTRDTPHHRDMFSFRSGTAPLSFALRNPKAANDGLPQIGKYSSHVTQKTLDNTQYTDESGAQWLTLAEPQEKTCNIADLLQLNHGGSIPAAGTPEAVCGREISSCKHEEEPRLECCLEPRWRPRCIIKTQSLNRWMVGVDSHTQTDPSHHEQHTNRHTDTRSGKTRVLGCFLVLYSMFRRVLGVLRRRS